MTHDLVAAMIVKNEAAVIDRVLASISPYVDKVFIDDNGSTDDTINLARAYGADVAQTTWVDFATDRNRVLSRAAKEGKYILCGIDADEELIVPEGFVWPKFTAHAYMLTVHYGDLRYPRAAIVDGDFNWRWKGVIHEVLVSDRPSAERVLIEGPYILVHTDKLGARARDPETPNKDLRTLRRAVEDEPTNPRYRFYLAQTLKDARQFAEAHEHYVARSLMPGWPPETAWATYMAGVTNSWREIDPMPWYAKAIALDPTMAEFYVSAARWYRGQSNWPMAMLFARHAAFMPYHGSPLFSEVDVYEWRALDELVMAAYYTGNMIIGRQAAKRLLNRKFPETERERIEANAAFFN
jgi:hypothetical protein